MACIHNHLKNDTLPEFGRMLLVGLAGVLFSFITYELVYWIVPFYPKTTWAWGIAYVIGVARQHALHRFFTFNYKTSYWSSLFRAYLVDSGLLVWSSILHWYLTGVMAIHHRWAWLICLVSTALLSYIGLKRFVFRKVLK